jgi:hypothetical protein
VKAERIPKWRVARMSTAERGAWNELRWYSPGAAERARLKLVLGWKRSRDETIALAHELRSEGRGDAAIADELGVTDRYLERLLEQGRDLPKPPRNPSAHAADLAPTCETNGAVPHRLSGRQMYDGDAFSYDLEAALGAAT